MHAHTTSSLSIMHCHIAPIFRLLQIILQWTWEYGYGFKTLFSFPLNIHAEADLLDRMAVWGFFFNFFRNPILFPIVTVPKYSFTSNLQGFPFLYILANTCYFFFLIAILTIEFWTVVFIWISLVISYFKTFSCIY